MRFRDALRQSLRFSVESPNFAKENPNSSMENHLVGLEEFMKGVKKLKDRLSVSNVPVKKE